MFYFCIFNYPEISRCKSGNLRGLTKNEKFVYNL